MSNNDPPWKEHCCQISWFKLSSVEIRDFIWNWSRLICVGKMYKHLGLFTSRAPFTHYTCLWTIFISIVCPFTGYLDHLVLISNGEATSQPFSTIPSSSPVTINLALHGRSLHCCPLAPFIPCSFWFLTF